MRRSLRVDGEIGEQTVGWRCRNCALVGTSRRFTGNPLGTALATPRDRMAGMRAVDPRVSYAELSTWPDDGRRWELYGGEPIAVLGPNWGHQRVITKLLALLTDHEYRAG